MENSNNDNKKFWAFYRWKDKLLFSSLIILIMLLFGIFIYPTLYRYDKLDQKYPVKINRITGSTKILGLKGWVSVDNPTKSEMNDLRQELFSKLEEDRANLKEDIINQIKADVVKQVNAELEIVRSDINQYKKFETNSNNYFTIGSTKTEVKKIMGVPSSIDDYFNTWYYGSSKITFKGNKVSDYYNGDNNLRVK